MKVAVVTGSIPTSGSPYTIAGPSGFGTPEGLVLIAGAPGDTIDSVIAELWDHIGFASASAQTCEAAWVADNATSGTAANYKRISYGDRIYTDDAEAVNIDAVNGAGPVTDGWELALDSAPGAAIPYVALLLGDTGGLAVGHAVDTAGAVTGLGFEPNFGMFATTGQDNDGSEDTVSTLGFGVVDSAGADWCHNLVKRSSTTNSIGEGRTGTMLAYKVLLASDAWSLNFDSWDSGGFSFTDTSGDGDRFAYLVLNSDGATITVSVEQTPGATGNASFDPGHLVQAIFGKATTQTAWATASQNAAAGAAAFFAADAAEEACHAVAAEHGSNPTDTQHELASAVFDVPADTGTAGQITGTMVDVEDVTINFTSANARGFLLVAFEESDTGVTGSGALTMGAQSSAATGTVLVEGDAAATLAAQAAAADGDVLVAGTGALQSAAQTTATTGGPVVQGTGAAQTAAQTVAGAGDTIVQGDATPTLSAQQASATGNVVVEGDAALNSPALEVSASGAVQILGSGAVTTAAQDTAAEGDIRVTGAAALTHGAQATAAAGDVLVQGEAAITNPAMDVSGSSQSTAFGDGAILTGGQLTSGSGTVLVEGSCALSFAAQALESEGDVLVRGAAACVVAAQQCAGGGDVFLAGSGACMFAPQALSSEGDVRVTGAGALDMPAQDVAGTTIAEIHVALVLPAQLCEAEGDAYFFSTRSIRTSSSDRTLLTGKATERPHLASTTTERKHLS